MQPAGLFGNNQLGTISVERAGAIELVSLSFKAHDKFHKLSLTSPLNGQGI